MEWTILWASGNYCGQLDLLIPIDHCAIGFKPIDLSAHPASVEMVAGDLDLGT